MRTATDPALARGPASTSAPRTAAPRAVTPPPPLALDAPAARLLRRSSAKTLLRWIGASTGALEPIARLLEPEQRSYTGIGLSGRIFLGATGLLIVTLGVAIGVASWQARRAAEEKIAGDLRAVPAIYGGYLDAQIAARRGQLRSLADQPGSKALLAETLLDAATLHGASADLAKSLGARLAFLFDDHGALLARSDQPDGAEMGRSFAEISWVRTPLDTRDSTTAFIVDVRTSPGLYLVSSAPVVQGRDREARLNGVIVGAFEMNRDRARELALVTGGDVAFLASVGPRDSAPRIRIVAATGTLVDAWLTDVRREHATFDQTVFVEGRPYGPFEFVTATDRYIGTALPIRSGGDEPIGAVVFARSKTAELAAFMAVRRSLLLSGLVVMIAALPLSLVVARRIARPIRQLAHGAEQIGRGQLDVTLPPAVAGEVGSLTRAFEGMVAELREKAALEQALANLQAGHTPAPIVVASSSTTSEFAQGMVFANRYQIVSLLGEGGMGTVYRAHDRELDDDVAMKCLRPELGSAETTASILKEEIKLARMITHVNVVRVYDVGESAGRRFFTMEYVRGQTLHELIDRGGAMAVTPALQIAKQVCRGLAAVHKAGIVHGDLKPQNVMVLPNGVAKLMDFGVARVRSQTAVSPSAAGTPLYMSPEQARGAELDERSDIYAAGVLMFELFTGRPPFMSADVLEIVRMHQHDRPPNPRLLRPDLPEALGRIILACLEKSHLQRPATASDLERLLIRVRP